MEFHEKITELRKSRGLTQEELAKILYVSRTAISKWESGRGYPNIDSLRELASFFSVSIDDLLSSEKLLTIAKKENNSNIRHLCLLLFGIVDIFFCMMIVLPLYPNTIGETIYSVNLLSYSDASLLTIKVHWFLFLLNIMVGVTELLVVNISNEFNYKTIISFSMLLNIIIVLFLAIVRESYAIILAFVLLIIKGFILIKYLNSFK